MHTINSILNSYRTLSNCSRNGAIHYWISQRISRDKNKKSLYVYIRYLDNFAKEFAHKTDLADGNPFTKYHKNHTHIHKHSHVRIVRASMRILLVILSTSLFLPLNLIILNEKRFQFSMKWNSQFSPNSMKEEKKKRAWQQKKYLIVSNDFDKWNIFKVQRCRNPFDC